MYLVSQGHRLRFFILARRVQVLHFGVRLGLPHLLQPHDLRRRQPPRLQLLLQDTQPWRLTTNLVYEAPPAPAASAALELFVGVCS
jgi:hypothetical protein